MDQLTVGRPVASQRRRPGDLAHVACRAAFVPELFPHAMLPEDLHRALVEIVGFWQDRSRVVSFEEEVIDAIVREETRKTETTASSPNNDDWNVNDVGHFAIR